MANIISGNKADPNAGDAFAEVGIFSDVIFSSGANVYGHSALSTAQSINVLPALNDILATSNGTNPTAIDDILDSSLEDNGGETKTHAMVVGSPALDATLSGPATDQRNVSRPQGTG